MPAPRIGTKLRTAFIKGMGKPNDRFVIILDINKRFSINKLAIVLTLSVNRDRSPYLFPDTYLLKAMR
jgi:purine-binding chemotaxis protein CheW